MHGVPPPRVASAKNINVLKPQEFWPLMENFACAHVWQLMVWHDQNTYNMYDFIHVMTYIYM